MNCTGNCRQGRSCTCRPEDTDRPSMLTNRLFWLAAVVSGLLWGLVDWLL